MRKDTLLEVIIGTIGGLVFAIGMCMCLLPEWGLFQTGVAVATTGFLILLLIIPVYRKAHPGKQHGPVRWSIVAAWVIGIAGALFMGFGMSRIMVGDPTQIDLLAGLVCGAIGLMVCVLDYPVYSYFSKK